MYTIHCAVYTVHYTLYSVHCTLYTVQCTLYSGQCTVVPIRNWNYRGGSGNDDDNILIYY